MSALARATDIDTSHAAGAHVVSSGLQAVQQDKAARAVTQNPGMTSHELAQATGLDRYMLARRLPELIKEGRVYRGQSRRCKVSDRSACTWWPVAPGQNLSLGI
ncbi:winged helix-turn-helix domain-containing protein [Stenotrophomonas maltophilia]|uniref:winged helix-turn-helix domain-containing protein n=1 Tax=Stenotrophomonas maltophilia TaxID=40324 RepID=UPI00209694F2|nr:winged helix-turn-helix domain-containing protein [Stenotrophomonas maltophilia]MCO7398291.1 winged helix-turn-helix domain-containing protein [Stenotrophomonas maltophilia]MCO7411493.1 winged helix-turn-helix domain-containing protein [Stenotrophomonas maltophilia]